MVECWENGRGCPSLETAVKLFQLLILGLSFLQDGDVGVGVFPEIEEVLVGGAAFCGVTGEGVGTGEAKMGECAQREVQHNAAVVQKLLELCGCAGAVTCH